MLEGAISAFRFVHAADVHLDSPLRSLALRTPGLANLIGNATRQAFERIIDLCLDERVDALLLAGDLYDGDQTSMKTALFLAGQLRRLSEAGIRTFIIRGNHDAASRITRELEFPDSVTVFGGRAGTVSIERGVGFPVAVHGLSFTQPQAPHCLLDKYRPPVPNAVNIGLMHTSLGGAPGHDVYAPCRLADLQRSGFQYWALGHVHKRMIVEGATTIVMPGIPQGRDITEAGAKSATLVTLREDGTIELEERVTSLAQFERLTADAAGAGSWEELVLRVSRALERARERVSCEHLVARVHLSGTTPLAWRIRRDLDLLTQELTGEAPEEAAGSRGYWIEKVETSCKAPGAPRTASPDPLLELQRLIEGEVLGSEAFQAGVEAMAQELRRKLKLPVADYRAVWDAFGDSETASREALKLLAQEGIEEVLARLHNDEQRGEARAPETP